MLVNNALRHFHIKIMKSFFCQFCVCFVLPHSFNSLISVISCFNNLTVLYLREFPLWSTQKTETMKPFSKLLKEQCIR